jgi:hypothetical protein
MASSASPLLLAAQSWQLHHKRHYVEGREQGLPPQHQQALSLEEGQNAACRALVLNIMLIFVWCLVVLEGVCCGLLGCWAGSPRAEARPVARPKVVAECAVSQCTAAAGGPLGRTPGSCACWECVHR